MALVRLDELTWKEASDLEGLEVVALLPVGAVEAHGPHLPLSTDEIIARAMAESGASQLSEGGRTAIVLPSIEYTAAPFADEFPGTLSISPDAVTAMIVEIGMALLRRGFAALGLANAHLDPTHLRSLHDATDRLNDAGLPTAFPDLTQRPWGSRLTDEFKSGACHAGRFETSVVMAHRGDLVREGIRQELAPHDVSLSKSIAAGSRTFREANGPMAYFGDPAAATVAEGHETTAVLGTILRDAVLLLDRATGSQ